MEYLRDVGYVRLAITLYYFVEIATTVLALFCWAEFADIFLLERPSVCQGL